MLCVAHESILPTLAFEVQVLLEGLCSCDIHWGLYYTQTFYVLKFTEYEKVYIPTHDAKICLFLNCNFMKVTSKTHSDNAIYNPLL